MPQSGDMSTGASEPQFRSQAAREAQAAGFGDERYWEYLDSSAKEHADYYLRHGDERTAAKMFTRSLSEALAGNDAD